MMKWEKLGIIFNPKGIGSWATKSAMLPTPLRLNDDIVRVYTSFCDDQGIGRPGFVDLDAKDLSRVVNVSKTPIFDIGTPGSFDDNGALVSSVVDLGDGFQYLYYVGFELTNKICYRMLTGLAISENYGETFYKYKTTPILERSADELFFRCGPFVTRENGCFRLWYIAGSEWTEFGGKQLPVCTLKYLESEDGIHWPLKGKIILTLDPVKEQGFGRPWIVRQSYGIYQMFYSTRCLLGKYQLGYAESSEGLNWERKDHLMGLHGTPRSFDSDMMTYSAAIEIGSETYCFYNGNNFGRDGIALAKLIP